MPSGFDVIVLGVGGFGSGTLYHLARRGARVLGIEQFGVAHDRGSSHGQTRIIRQAYFEHPDYVPLLRRAYDLWHALEQETGRTLFHQVGLFLAGAPDAEAIHGTQLAAQTHQLPLERLDALQARNRFPGYRFPEDWAVLFERQAGYLAVEACVQAHVDAALAHGAQLLTGETVRGIEPTNDGVRVRTDRETYDAGRLVVTAGPWAARLLAEVGTTAGWSDCLRVVRKPVFWFPAGAEFDVAQGNSTFFFETAAGQFYGFPRLDGRSIKVAEHTQGDAVDDPL
ncbi:MAG: N-methyl-L-tryptophan oxidase, partial [Planctomycetales bacterium]